MTLPTFCVTSIEHISPHQGRLQLRCNFIRRFLLGTFLIALVPVRVFAHASLVSSVPAAGSTVSQPPAEIRLLFSERIEVAMCRAMLVQGKSSTMLEVRADPQNAKGLIADLAPVQAGNVEIMWHVLSVDGHAISGTLHFIVGAAPLHLDTIQKSSAPEKEPEPSRSALTWFAMLLRGIGMTALMGFAGLLMFASASAQAGGTQHSSLAGKLVATASLALLAHFICWALISTSGLPGAHVTDVLQTSAGKVEGGRTLLAVLALASWLARKQRLSLLLAGAGVFSGAFAGHAAAIHPAVSISFKLIHLAAASVWVGGLIWILLLDVNSSEVFRVQVERVSNAAGWCAALVLVSGIVQAGIILSWDTGSLTTGYAAVAGLKVLGIIVLMGLGAINRFRLIPALGIAGFAQKLHSTVSREVSIMILVALLGGVLSYLSPPESRPTAAQPRQSTAPSPVRA